MHQSFIIILILIIKPSLHLYNLIKEINTKSSRKSFRNYKKLTMCNLKFIAIGIMCVIIKSETSAQSNGDPAVPQTIEIDRSINPSVDTILHKSLPTVEIVEKNKVRTPQEEEAYQKLKRRVIKLYPYALMARQIYETSAQATSSMSNKEKRTYLKTKEKELRQRFENEIKALYTTDGPVLVKLIHRETNKTTYELLRESKSWINCMFYQMAAKNHGYSLKDTYDPKVDIDIENMVQMLKSEGQLPVYSGM